MLFPSQALPVFLRHAQPRTATGLPTRVLTTSLRYTRTVSVHKSAYFKIPGGEPERLLLALLDLRAVQDHVPVRRAEEISGLCKSSFTKRPKSSELRRLCNATYNHSGCLRGENSGLTCASSQCVLKQKIENKVLFPNRFFTEPQNPGVDSLTGAQKKKRAKTGRVFLDP